jgi:hypothetical protein
LLAESRVENCDAAKFPLQYLWQAADRGRIKGLNVMSQNTIGLDETQEDILYADVSDEELETAAATGKQNAGAQTLPYALICIPFSQ